MNVFAIEVNFLTGRYVATTHHDRGQAEWPPHPARLFSALVATWADADSPDQVERSALEWLEGQGPPSIAAPDAEQRTVVTHFVPVNDARISSRSSHDKAVDIMPPGWLSTFVRKNKTWEAYVRTGQARQYPSVTPTEPRVTYMWQSGPTADLVRAVDGLCARLTRLGHSSSLVACRVVGNGQTPNYVPGEGGTVLRSVGPGQLDALEREYARHRGSKPRILPFTPVRYRLPAPDATEGESYRPDTAGDWLVFAFRRGSKGYPSTIAVEVASALRGAVLRYASDPIPEGLSGHRKTGHPSTDPHVAFLPLPWVENDHADGRLMGVALAMPGQLASGSRRAAFRAIGRWENDQDPLTLTLGRRGRLQMDRVTGPSPLVTLRPSVWRRPARRWVSATAIALPTHPGRLSSGSVAARRKAWARAEDAVINSCRHVGLPEPQDVAVSLAPLIVGARPAPAFPAFRQPGPGGRLIARRLVHAAVTFEEPIIGPLVLGAGRYLGLGLMRPVPERRPSDG